MAEKRQFVGAGLCCYLRGFIENKYTEMIAILVMPSETSPIDLANYFMRLVTMYKIKLLFLVVGVSVFLAGCSSVERLERSTEYKSVCDTNENAIKLPRDLNGNTIDTYYKVPAVKKSSKKNVSILPPGFKGN